MGTKYVDLNSCLCFVQFVLSLCIISTLNKTIEKSRQNMNDKLCLIELVNSPTDSVGGQHRLID